MDYEHILYEQDGGKARITLNRPEKLNAISLRLQRELHDALWQADAAAGVHAILLRGAGRAFSAGYDMSPDQPRDESHAPGAPGRRSGREFYRIVAEQGLKAALEWRDGAFADLSGSEAAK